MKHNDLRDRLVLLSAVVSKEKYPLSLFLAIANWQGGGKCGDASLCAHIKKFVPARFKKVTQPIYRGLLFSDDGTPLSTKRAVVGPSSWSTDTEAVFDHLDGLGDVMGMLRIAKPDPSKVILNVNAFYDDPEVLAAYNALKAKHPKEFEPFRYMTIPNAKAMYEIIYETDRVYHRDDVWRWIDFDKGYKLIPPRRKAT